MKCKQTYVKLNCKQIIYLGTPLFYHLWQKLYVTAIGLRHPVAHISQLEHCLLFLGALINSYPLFVGFDIGKRTYHNRLGHHS
jgi:hypothetical protein